MRRSFSILLAVSLGLHVSCHSPEVCPSVDMVDPSAGQPADHDQSCLDQWIYIRGIRENSRTEVIWDLLPGVGRDFAEERLRWHLQRHARSERPDRRAYLVAILAELRGEEFPIFTYELESEREGRIQHYLGQLP